MATFSFFTTTGDTGASPNTSTAFTPATGDLLVIFVVASDTTAGATDSLTSSLGGGLTFHKAASVAYRTNADMVFCYVSNSLITAGQAVSQTVDWTSSDASTGTHIATGKLTGMSRAGSSAVKQSATAPNQAASGTPATTFASAAQTGNPTFSCLGNSTNPANVTVTSGWTRHSASGYATPATGICMESRDSGFTGTTITWGSTSPTAFGVLAVELDASVPSIPNKIVQVSQAIKRASFY
jgi:hypothetical protein